MRRTVSIFLASALLTVSVPLASAQKSKPDLSPDSKKPGVDTGQVQPDPVKHRQVISQPGVRIAAKGDGLIRVTRIQLQAAGFNTNSSPANWQLFLEGVELPIIVGPNAEYIEFLGKELDTVESDIRTYYLTVGAQAGKRISVTQVKPSKGKGGQVTVSYPQTTVKAERTFYANQILNGPLGNYFGRVVAAAGTTYNFTLTGIDRSEGSRTLTVAFQGFSLAPHSVQLMLNGNVLESVTGTGRDFMTKSYSIPVAYLLEGQNSLQMSTSASSVLFDHITINFPRNFIAEGNRLDFSTERNKGARLSGFTTADVRVFDVMSETAATEIVGAEIVETAGTFGPAVPADNRARLMYATEASNIAAPISVTPNDPALLGVPTESGQLVIIAHPSLMAEARTWGNYRVSQGVPTKVVDVTEIFDEFSYGISSSDAIEAFLNYAKNNWQVKPGYVLLIGDGSYDPRNYTGAGYWNMVPTRMGNTAYEETGSDEALADFNNDGLAEIPIGRISARTPAAVTTVYNKVVTWESNLGSDPLERGALFAYDQFDGYNFQAMSGRIAAKLPADMPKTNIQRGIPDNVSAQAAVIGALNSGKYIANYAGHGTAGAWRDGNFFANPQIPLLTNANSPTLITALTCLNGYFVNPSAAGESFAERMLGAPNGGAVAIWASTGKTTPDVQEVMALRFYEQLSLGNTPRLGDLIKDAKSQLNAGADVRLSWALFGDPMLKVR